IPSGDLIFHLLFLCHLSCFLLPDKPFPYASIHLQLSVCSARQSEGSSFFSVHLVGLQRLVFRMAPFLRLFPHLLVALLSLDNEILAHSIPSALFPSVSDPRTVHCPLLPGEMWFVFDHGSYKLFHIFPDQV